MSANWLLLVIVTGVVVFEQGSCIPDFGVPAIVLDSGLVIINANLLRDAMNEVLNPLRRMPSTLHLVQLRKAANSISKLVQNVTEKGKHLASNFSKAVIERKIPSADVFKSLYFAFGELGQYLTDDGAVFVRQLQEMLGNITANEYERALENMNSSLLDTLKATSNLEHAVGDSLKAVSPIPMILGIPNVWSQELSKELAKLRDQVRTFGKAVDASVKSIDVSNSKIDTVNSNIRLAKSSFKFTLSMFYSTVDYEFNSVVKKYKSAQRSFQSDFAVATQRLKIFSPNKTLNALSELHTAEFTKHYYELYNRNESDMTILHNTFDSIRLNVTKDLDSGGQLFFGAVNNSALALVSVILARGRFSEQCNGKFSSSLSAPFAGFQTKTTGCLSRERRRISKISDVIDRVLLLVQSNSVDFSSDVGSCSRFTAFASNEVDYLQAKACLEANLREMYSYNRLMNTQLDSLQPILNAEAEASNFRTRQCIMKTVKELSALLDGVKAAIQKCAVSGP